MMASFGPETVKAMGQAFDQAWAEIAGNFGDTPTQVESARLRLAEAVLSVTSEDSRDVAALKLGALQAMAMDYRTGISSKIQTEAQGLLCSSVVDAARGSSCCCSIDIDPRRLTWIRGPDPSPDRPLPGRLGVRCSSGP
jgi:hypothetical protein